MSLSNVIGGKLKLKGTALDVRAGGMKKKKKRREMQEREQEQILMLKAQQEEGNNSDPGRTSEEDPVGGLKKKSDEGGERHPAPEDHRTAAEKRYHEQKARLEARRLSKVATKSHRQRVEEFNQYLANLSEHYDIPKVGPG